MNILVFLLQGKITGNHKAHSPPSGHPSTKSHPTFIDYKTGQNINADYQALQKELAPKRAQAPSRPGLVKLLGAAVNNVRNVAKNAFDNTVGYGISQYQNYQTRRELRGDPESAKKYMTVHIPGLFQNIGSQWRFARLERQKGRLPYHLHPYNGLPKAEREEAAKRQLEYLKKETGANPYKVVSGHSDGAALAIGLDQDKKTVKEHHLAYVQARAPSVHGIQEHNTLGKLILMPLAPNDNVQKSIYARKGAVENAAKKPYAKVDIVAGEQDGLVVPSDAVYKHANRHYLVRGKDSTHFGTSGGNDSMNQRFSTHIDDLVKEHQKSQQKEQMTVAKSYGVQTYKPYEKSGQQKYKKADHH